jgi:hypothetical protein
METLSTWIRGAFTLLLLVLTVWWLTVVASKLGNKPQVDESGAVTLDEFQRAKDILLVVLPLLTTALGYWFGAAGKATAEEKAEAATTQLQEVLDVGGEGLLAAAKQRNPGAFGLPAGEGGQ